MSEYESDSLDAAADRHDEEARVLKEEREAQDAKVQQAGYDYLEAGRRYGSRSLHAPDYKGAHFVYQRQAPSHRPVRHHQPRSNYQGFGGGGGYSTADDGKGGPGGRGWMHMFLKGWKDLFWDK